jgi:trimeric autotransporter adhesin
LSYRIVLFAAAAALLVTAACAKVESPASPSAATGITSIIVAGTPPAIGASSQFTALGTKADGSSVAVTSQVTWQSSNTAIATVSNGGLVTGMAAGSVEIAATAGSVKGSLTFAVTAPATYVLKGTVMAATSSAGVAGATVTAKDGGGATKSATSDASGRYAIAGLAPGRWDVSAAAPNFVAATTSVTVLADATVDFRLASAPACPLIGFDDLQTHGAPFDQYARCGITVASTTSNWTVSTSYGRPAPFIQFMSNAGGTTIGEILVTAAGTKFRFESVDIYSSTTPIPYAITGIANSTTVFTIQATQGNTFGDFATVSNPQASTAIDALLIRLTNPAAPCCSNPVGLDNIRLAF